MSTRPELLLSGDPRSSENSQSRPRDVVIVAHVVTTVSDVISILSVKLGLTTGAASAPAKAGSRESLLFFPLLSLSFSLFLSLLSSLLQGPLARDLALSRTHTHSLRTRSRARNTRAHGITGRAADVQSVWQLSFL